MNPPPEVLKATALRRAAEARLKARPQPRQPLSELELQQFQSELELRRLELEILEEERRYSEASLNRAQAMAHVGNWSFDLRSGALAWSPEMYRIHGVKPETFEPTFSGLKGLVHPDDWPKHLQAHEASLRGVAFEPYECRVIRPDGDLRFVSVPTADLERDLSGQIIRIFGAVQDITERKRDELALRASEERFRQLTESITDVFWIASPDVEQIQYVSPGYEQIWGRTPESLYARPHQWIEAVLPEDRDRVASDFASLRATEPVVSTEYRIARPDGTVRWILDRGFQVRNALDKIIRLTGVARDITQQRQAEHALRESQQKFSRLFHSSPIAISLSTRLGGRYLDVNQEFLRLVKKPREEVIGRTALELGVWADPAQREAFVRQIVEAGSLRNVELRAPLPDGKIRQILWSAEALDIGGEPCLLNSMLDITERKQAENLATMSREVLQILNAPGTLKSVMQDVLEVMKRRTGFDAVGLRLQAGNDFPYFVQAGFSDSFLRTENSLVSRTMAGGLCRDQAGRVTLECTCGLVLSGQVQPGHPLATPKGSIWTNDSSTLLGLSAAPDPRLHPRNECIHQGYASVALVAIRCHAQILGLIQFNDRRKDSFTPQLVEQLEEIASHLGLALLRKQAEDALRQSEDRYALVEQATNDGLWDWNILTNEEYFSPRWKEIIGLHGDELPGHKSEFFKRVHPEDLPRVQAVTAEHLAGIRRYEVEFRLRHKDGSYRWVFSRAKAVRDAAGRPVRMVGSTTDITERKEAEVKQARLASIVESSLDGIISKNLDGTITTWNPGAEQLFGYAAEEILGTSIQRLIPEDRLPEENDILERIRRGENVMHFDTVRLRQGGQLFDASVTASPIRDATGQIIGVSKTIRDITERKRTEAALLASEAQFRTMFDVSPVPLALNDQRQRITLLNQAFGQTFGYTQLDIPTLADWWPKAYPDPAYRQSVIDAWQAEFARMEKTGATFSPQEVTVCCKNGTVKTVLGSAAALSGSFAGTHLVILYDITERKRAEEQLRVQISALTATANAIVITNRDGQIEWVNPAFTQLTRYSAEEVVGQNMGFLQSGQQSPAFYATLWATILAGNVWHGEMNNQRKDGELYTEEMTITPVRGADGLIAHFVSVSQDVTERRLMEKRMLQAQKMEAIGTLAGGIAHDFNNMLAAMFGYAHLLQQDTVGNSLAQESVAEILTAANRAKELVQQILSFSRQREQKPQVVRLEPIVKEVLKFLRASLPAHIKIEREMAAETPAVMADPTQIYQLVMNLATNALHAMEDAPGRLLVRLDPVHPDEELRRAHPQLKPMLYARLTVADTGHGMDAKTLERIFEPFFTTKPVGRGTGLGLAVVHGIMETHNGVITVESQVGQGTTFHAYFPAQAQAEAPIAIPASAVPQGHGQKILAVDDEPALTSWLAKMLHRLNYQVTTSNQASDAIRMVHANAAAFDLVITDLTMPEMSGLELAKQIHAIRPELPVILVSGYSVSVTADHLLVAGICERLEKPVSPPALAEVLARVLKKV